MAILVSNFFADFKGVALINPGAFINNEYAVIDEEKCYLFFYRNDVVIKKF
ncbi:MAG: hypothetical protein L6U99_13850 [Clostridium sp.]|nr:MAG: hypothetical protein L6U99_13850 [Clostridium sp.]